MAVMRRICGVLLVLLCLGRLSLSAEDLQQARALFDGEKYPEAYAAYEALLPELQGEEWATAAYQAAYCLERTHRREEAVAAYRQVAESPQAAPRQQAAALLRLGNVLSLMQRPEEARAELEKVPGLVGAEPNTVAESLLVAGSVCYKLHDLDAALAALDRIGAIAGVAPYTVAESYVRRAGLCYREKRYPEAAESYRKVLAAAGANARQKASAQGALEELDLILGGDKPFYIRPYVTQTAPAGANLRWVALGPLPPGLVTLKGAGQEMSFSSQTQALLTTACFRHTAALTNLQPGTPYSYRVTCGKESVDGSFRTPPVTPAPVSFAVLGDTQAAPQLHARVAEAIARDDPDFVVHVGDLTDLGSAWGRWRAELFEPGHAYLSRCAFWPAVGNHDGGPFFPRLFGLEDRFYYSFTYGNLHVVMIDSYWAGSVRQKQLDWLRRDLAGSQATWKVAVLHVPMVAVGLGPELKWFGREDFLPLMEEAGVDLVFSGHIPLYRRFLPIGKPGNKPVIHVTSGGGGPVGAPAPSPIMAAGAGVPHHSLVRVDGNRLELVAREPDGTVLDRLVLEKKDGRYQEEVMAQAVAPDLASRIHFVYQELMSASAPVLAARFASRPRPGETATVVVNLRRLPRGGILPDSLPPGAELVLKGASGCAWTLAEQARSLRQETLAYTVSVPTNFVAGAGGFTPPLEVTMTLRVEGRLFESCTCPVALPPEDFRALFP